MCVCDRYGNQKNDLQKACFIVTLEHRVETLVQGRVQPPPERIVLIWRYHHSVYTRLRNVVRSLETYTEIPKRGVRWSRPDMRTVVILDDVMDEVHEVSISNVTDWK